MLGLIGSQIMYYVMIADSIAPAPRLASRQTKMQYSDGTSVFLAHRARQQDAVCYGAMVGIEVEPAAFLVCLYNCFHLKAEQRSFGSEG